MREAFGLEPKRVRRVLPINVPIPPPKRLIVLVSSLACALLLRPLLRSPGRNSSIPSNTVYMSAIFTEPRQVPHNTPSKAAASLEGTGFPKPYKGLVFFERRRSYFLMDGDGAKMRKLINHAWVAGLSPDAKMIAYCEGDAIGLLSVANDATKEIVRLNQNQSVVTMAWSPDGKSLAYLTADTSVRSSFSWKLHILSLLERQPRDLGDVARGRSLTFSPDGAYVAAISPDRKQVRRIAVQNGMHETAFQVGQAGQELRDVRFSPDGRKIAFIVTDQEGSLSRLLALELGSKKSPVEIHYRGLPSGLNTVYDFDWSPDSQSIAVGVGNSELGYPPSLGLIYATSVDQAKQQQLTSDGICLRAKFSPDGQSIIYTNFTGRLSGLYRLELSDKKVVRLTNPGDNGQDFVADWR